MRKMRARMRNARLLLLHERRSFISILAFREKIFSHHQKIRGEKKRRLLELECKFLYNINALAHTYKPTHT